MINPRVASGTRDLLPEQAIAREWLLGALRDTFVRHGFVPIDTPILERREVLYAKGGDEVHRQVYEVYQRGTDPASGKLALRFDLTVPLARYMAAHVSEVGVPFKRYHIGPVFRGERAQRGRYREFYQCDFDILGTRSALADAEIAEIIHDGLAAVGIPDFRIRLNDRRVLDGVLDLTGLSTVRTAVLRALDKLDKQGRESVVNEIRSVVEGLGGGDGAGPTPAERAEKVLSTVEGLRGTDAADSLRRMRELLSSCQGSVEGVDRLERVVQLLSQAGVPPQRLVIDPTLARGLDYYTGIVYEAVVVGYEGYGTVAAGGRYDDLAGLFTSVEIPGVGASFGIDRLLAVMSEAGWLKPTRSTAPVLIVNFPDGDEGLYFRVARRLRARGIGCEIYPDQKPLRAQLGYASSRGYRFAVIMGPDEIAAGQFALRDLTTRQQEKELPLERIEDIIAERIRA